MSSCGQCLKSIYSERSPGQKAWIVTLSLATLFATIVACLELHYGEISPLHQTFDWLKESDVGNIVFLGFATTFVVNILYLRGVVNRNNTKKQISLVISTGNITEVQKALKKVPLELLFHDYSLLKAAALKVNATDATRGDRAQNQKEILVELHKAYNQYLLTKPKNIRAGLAMQAVLITAECCMDVVPTQVPPLLGCTNRDIQQYFGRILAEYVPDCPHTVYVPESSLGGVAQGYNANQKMYAEWCHLTALATKELLPKKSLDALIQLGSRSRSVLAKICGTPQAERFGQLRTPDRIDGTPIAGPRYSKWFGVTHREWFRRLTTTPGHEFCILVYRPDGSRFEGTKFGNFRYAASEGQGSQEHFCWVHGPDLDNLPEATQQWLSYIMDFNVDNSKGLLLSIGLFYHTFVQYTPYKRGSAAVGNIFLSAMLMHFKEKYPKFSLPKAVENLDCYALSIQANDFIEKAFLPWCHGEDGERLFNSLLA